ncbi:MAG TPA: Asp-tRNA(Asn)/Glu-tRNA(Gln) amidotransferase subunit GatA [Candidatus Omnitrophica bacterium]|nr:Asp-tRNA(Asn)/Glu-tRNA(Gln) amidotransferase subunit GatA [Candidatus Omnitrophota bacterium]
MDITELTANQLKKNIDNGEISVKELIKSYIKKIEDTDQTINAYIYVDKEMALKEAEKLDNNKNTLPLKGLPIATKDNICVEGEPTTCASRILKDFKPPYSAAVIEKLKKYGAIILGRTNMDEFAFGSSCETSCYGITKNPHDTSCVPGGSSGGSAAAVGAQEALWALGSDTGGSIRQPASLCGVVGLKPTYGTVSRFGLIAFASSLDQIGPITRDIPDAAMLLEAISGFDERDSTSVNRETPLFSQKLTPEIKNIKIGVPEEYFSEGIEDEIKIKIDSLIQDLKKEGAKIEYTNLPHAEYAISCYCIIASSEASSNLARYDGVQYGLRESGSDFQEDANDMVKMYLATKSSGFGSEAKRRLILGTYSLSSGYYDAYYLRAARVRTLIKNDFKNEFKKYDCLISPTSPTCAFKIGEKIEDPLKMYLSDICTISANLAGIPAISVPIGKNSKGLPIGLQIMCDYFQEQKMLNIAYGIEKIYSR